MEGHVFRTGILLLAIVCRNSPEIAVNPCCPVYLDHARTTAPVFNLKTMLIDASAPFHTRESNANQFMVTARCTGHVKMEEHV
jgi:hypothetical protein